ncbi:hypothetical protein [Halobacillus yeomjeoni]|uniref:Uncharacterized protein n=1 Tax=Halobacillus yeomjeoni TaxID=311194 RepID=A0A931HU62_9BACI|nr:hypothetical protein [Halobacillus yeomjeoni]MBH0229444.1 hypothetical protein [Halobacillus yeomjeoni]
MPAIIFGLFYPLILGILFALPSLWERIKLQQAKGFKVNKFLGVGLPAMYILSSPYLYYGMRLNLLFTRLFSNYSTEAGMLFSFLLGYLAIDCISSKGKA